LIKTGFFLGIETSSEITGLAIVKEAELHYELRGLTGSKHNETIFQLLNDALKFVGIEVKDLSGIGVSVGPGMFTSLRVGLALAKGFALPHQIPVKGINTLDALAHSVSNFAKANDLVVPIIDARKEEVFAAFYRKNERISEYLILKPETLANQITNPVFLVGNGLKKYKSLLESIIPKGFNSVLLEAPLPSTIAFQAQKSIMTGDISDLASLQPFYLRPTDAELKRQEKVKNVS
jgi:tRNA threonylcarbamoyladenosine biosynthesis protein TsaB